MGKLKEFQIRLAGDKTVYYPGDVITGDLHMRLESPMELRGIKIKLKGEGRVHWTEQESRGSGDSQHTVTVHYRGTDNLFKHKVNVFGKEGGDEKTSLPQGEHNFPFSYELPHRLPTSYEDATGRVRYEIKAKIDKPWKADKKTRRLFTVLETVDLNNVSNAMVPATGDETKYLCCWCCKSGPIKAEFQADRSAYVPGEFVTINASLKNKSNSKVKETSTSLMQKVTYHATRKSRIRWNQVVSLTGKECKKGKTITWTNERLQIPPVPPTMRGSCKVLDIEYYLMFQGHLRMCAVDLRELEEITVGTVPIAGLDIYQNTGAEQSVRQAIESALPSAIGEQQPQQPAARQIAPPRAIYKPSAGVVNLAAEDDSGKTMGDASFSPQYTFYDWNQTSFTYT